MVLHVVTSESPAELTKGQMLGPTAVSLSVYLEKSPRTCISKKLPGDVNTTELGDHTLETSTTDKTQRTGHLVLVCLFLAILVFLTPLLRYNSHTIQFSHLKYTIQWFLLYLQIRATITAFFIGQ